MHQSPRLYYNKMKPLTYCTSVHMRRSSSEAKAMSLNMLSNKKYYLKYTPKATGNLSNTGSLHEDSLRLI